QDGGQPDPSSHGGDLSRSPPCFSVGIGLSIEPVLAPDHSGLLLAASTACNTTSRSRGVNVPSFRTLFSALPASVEDITSLTRGANRERIEARSLPACRRPRNEDLSHILTV